MAGGLLAGGLSLTRDQLILLTLVAAVFALLLTANLGLCWLYRRLLTEDQRHLRRAQKKKMSDVWVYQVHRPAPSAVQPLPADPPSQQILRKLRNSYDNLRTAVEAGEGPGVTLGREESQVIEELEATADLFLHDTPSRRSSLSVYDNDVNTAPFPDHIDINAFTAGGRDTDNTSDQARGMTNLQHKHSSLTDYDNDVNAASLLDRTDMNAFITGGGGDTDITSDQAQGVTNLQHRHSALTGYDNCRSPVSVHSGGGLSSFSSIPVDDDSVFNHDLDVSVPNNVYQTHLSVLQHREDSAAPVEVFASNHTETRPTNDVSALADVDNSLRDKVSFSSVTMEDFETNPLGPGVGVRGGGGKRRKKGKRRGSTYDNVALQSFPVAEFHNEAFDFAAAAAGPASLEGAHHSRTDLEL